MFCYIAKSNTVSCRCFVLILEHKIQNTKQTSQKGVQCVQQKSNDKDEGDGLECPDEFICRSSTPKICGLHLIKDNICDGIPQCELMEDETQCILDCPEGCQCFNESMLYRCSSSSLPHIPNGTYALDFSNSQIDINSLNDSWYFLIYLNLSSNDISDVSLFQQKNNFRILRVLDLSFNRIKRVSTFLLPALKELYLVGNPIASININLQLRKLSLRGTALQSLHWIRHAFLTSVLSLDISNSKVKVLSNSHTMLEDIFNLKHNNALVSLDLSHNLVKSIDVFCPTCSNLTKLDLSYNKLRVLTIRSFAGLSSLRRLFLRGNMLTKITKYSFAVAVRIVELDLGENSISYVDNDAFDKFFHLSKLYLDHNKLTYIPDTLFLNVRWLTELNLAGNELKTISFKLLSSIRNILRLNLSSNYIIIREESIFRNQAALKTLDLRNNPTLITLWEMFKGLSQLETLYVDSFTLCCARPRHLAGSDCIYAERSIASCLELLNVGVVKVFIWYAAVLIFVLNYRVISHRIRNGLISQSSRDVLVTQLSLTDIAVGLYLLAIGTFDKVSETRYAYYDLQWRKGGMCVCRQAF